MYSTTPLAVYDICDGYSVPDTFAISFDTSLFVSDGEQQMPAHAPALGPVGASDSLTLAPSDFTPPDACVVEPFNEAVFVSADYLWVDSATDSAEGAAAVCGTGQHTPLTESVDSVDSAPSDMESQIDSVYTNSRDDEVDDDDDDDDHDNDRASDSDAPLGSPGPQPLAPRVYRTPVWRMPPDILPWDLYCESRSVLEQVLYKLLMLRIDPDTASAMTLAKLGAACRDEHRQLFTPRFFLYAARNQICRLQLRVPRLRAYDKYATETGVLARDLDDKMARWRTLMGSVQKHADDDGNFGKVPFSRCVVQTWSPTGRLDQFEHLRRLLVQGCTITEMASSFGLTDKATYRLISSDEICRVTFAEKSPLRLLHRAVMRVVFTEMNRKARRMQQMEDERARLRDMAKVQLEPEIEAGILLAEEGRSLRARKKKAEISAAALKKQQKQQERLRTQQLQSAAASVTLAGVSSTIGLFVPAFSFVQ